MKKVVRLKLTCKDCGNHGYVQLSKRDLKSLRHLLSKPPQTKWGLWARVTIYEAQK